MIDLLVVGGGPAGLATAMYGVRAGLEVVVVERRTGPIDKACGEGLMPHTLRHLNGLGVHPHGRAIRGISYRDGTGHADAVFKRATGRGVRRTVLHGALLDAAMSAGVRIYHGDAGEISQDATSVRAGRWRARYLAAADGLHSPIRRALGLELPSPGPRRWGIRRHVQIAPWSDYVEVHWASGAEAYVTPIADDCVGVAMLTSRRGGFDATWRSSPLCMTGSRSAARAGPCRGPAAAEGVEPDGRAGAAGGRRGRLRRRIDRRGTRLGVRRRGTVGELCCRRPAADYDRQWRQMTRRYRMLTAALLHASAHALARARIVPAAAAMPSVFTGVVNLLAQ